MDPRMAMVADRNPLFTDNPVSLAVSNPDGEGFINSPLHENGAGQNVVFMTGETQWFTRPDVGVNGDDIYRSGELMRYVGNETPLFETESFLVP
jgi:hypothetical protein